MNIDAAPAAKSPAQPGERHISLWGLLGVWAALLGLTALTVAASQINLGAMNVWIALGIATLKAVLVLLFFMHMLYERPINFIVLCTALIFVGLFIGMVLLDTSAYNPDRIPDYAPEMLR